MGKFVAIDKEYLMMFKDAFINPDTLDSILENTIELSTDESIEDRAKKYLEQKGIKNYILNREELCEHWTTPTDLIVQGATEQSLIEQMKMKEFPEWILRNGYALMSKGKWGIPFTGNLQEFTTEELFNQFTNKKITTKNYNKMEKYHGNTVEYWKKNAEEDYRKTPISVLKYITVLEEQSAEQMKIKELKCDCTHTQACKICADEKGIDWSIIESANKQSQFTNQKQ